MEEKYLTLNFCLLSSGKKKNLIPILPQWNFYQHLTLRRVQNKSVAEALV